MKRTLIGLALLVAVSLLFEACKIDVPDLYIARQRRTATNPSTAALYFEGTGYSQPMAVLEGVSFASGEDPDPLPTAPYEPKDPDEPKPLPLPPTPTPAPIPNPCKPPLCTDFNAPDGMEYFWGVKKKPKPGDPPPPFFMIRDPRNSTYPGLTTIYAGRVPILVVRRMVITSTEFQSPFDTAATGVAQAVVLPNPVPKPVTPPICAFAICFEFSHGSDRVLQIIKIRGS